MIKKVLRVKESTDFKNIIESYHMHQNVKDGHILLWMPKTELISFTW